MFPWPYSEQSSESANRLRKRKPARVRYSQNLLRHDWGFVCLGMSRQAACLTEHRCLGTGVSAGMQCLGGQRA